MANDPRRPQEVGVTSRLRIGDRFATAAESEDPSWEASDAVVARPGRSLGRIDDHQQSPWWSIEQLKRRVKTDSLLRNSLFIMATTIVNSAFGFVFWLVAARLFPARVVGLTAAIVSASTVIILLASLGVGGMLIQSLPPHRNVARWSTTFWAGMGTALLCSVALGFVALWILPLFTDELAVLHSASYVAVFMIGTLAMTIGAILDYVFIAERAAGRMTARNTVVAMSKVAIAVVLTVVLGKDALNLLNAWALAATVGLIAGIILLAREVRVNRPPSVATLAKTAFSLRSRVAGNQLIGMGGALLPFVVPVLVTARLSSTENAYFYTTWMMAGIFLVVSPAVSQALFAEGIHGPQELAGKARSAFAVIGAILAPCIAAMFVFGGPLLSVFGATYERQSVGLLRIVLLAAVADAVTNVYVAVLRVEGRLAAAGCLNLGMGIGIVVLSWILLPSLGIEAVGWAFLAMQLCGCVYVFIDLSPSMMRRRSRIQLMSSPTSSGVAPRSVPSVDPSEGVGVPAREIVAPRRVRVDLSKLAWLPCCICLPIGAALVTLAANLASVSRGVEHFGVFWIGMAIGATPLVLYAASRYSNRTQKTIALLGLSTLTFVPRFVMMLHGPITYDEMGHYRELVEVVRTGRLFQPNTLVPLSQHFPGLEASTAALHSLSGLDLWQSALLIIFLAHCVGPLLAFLIAERLNFTPLGCIVTAFIFICNASYMFFDNQYVYEALAIPIALLAVFCLLKLAGASNPTEAVAWTVLGVVSGLGMIVTHHLTSIAFAPILLVLGIAYWPRNADPVGSVKEKTADSRVSATVLRRCLFAYAATIVLALVAWIAFEAPETYQYLSPFVREGVSDLGAFTGLVHASAAGSSRQLLTNSYLPLYEIVCLYLSPVLLAGFCAAATLFWFRNRPKAQLRKRDARQWSRLSLPILLIASLYFLSLPFDFTRGGAPGAHRSWAYTFPFVGLAIGWLVSATQEKSRQLWRSRSSAVRITALACLAAVLGVVFIGNVPGSVAIDERFPGPYLWGSETWGVSPEVLSAVTWMNADGSKGKVYSDLFTNELVYSRTSLGVNSVDDPYEASMFFETKPVEPKTWEYLRKNGYTYVVVDRRWSDHVGFHVSPFSSKLNGRFTTPKALNRFNSYYWTPLVYQSSNYSVYTIDYGPHGSVK